MQLHPGIRWFIVQDVELIEEDVEQLRLLFLAEGDGLPSDQVTQACGPLTSILTVMQLETGILISNYQQVWFKPHKHDTIMAIMGWVCILHRTSLAMSCPSGSFCEQPAFVGRMRVAPCQWACVYAPLHILWYISRTALVLSVARFQRPNRT